MTKTVCRFINILVAVVVLGGCLSTERYFIEVESPQLRKGSISDSYKPGDPEKFREYDFSRIDAYIREIPAEAEGSMDRLVDYISEGAHNDVEKIRALFGWISSNMSYDFRASFTEEIDTLSPAEIFYSRKGVCCHYAALFEHLAWESGVIAHTIVGIATGYPGDILREKTNHAWNVVRIDGEWYLIDVTWGSGYIEQKDFVVFLDDYYFLTVPEEFVKSHFPNDYKWQLLPQPISFDDFLEIAIEKSRNSG